MANRAHLYSLNSDSKKYTGLSEWGHEVPLTYKILMSGNPQTTKSAIWPDFEDGDIAIKADAEIGIQKLEKFLNSIKKPGIEELREEALSFLKDPQNLNDYLVLEAGEIYEIEGEDLVEENQKLFSEIQNIDSKLELIIEELNKVNKPNFISKIFNKKQNDENELWKIGLGFWDNILYYDLSETENT